MVKMRNKIYSALRWSEKYTKTDMLYLTKGGFWLFFGQALGVFVSLLLAIAFANLIEPEKYGNYKYVLSLAAIIGAFSLTGLSTAVVRAAARGDEGTLKYAYRLSLLWSVGMILISGIGSIYYFLNENYFLSFSLIVIGATSPVISASSLYRPFLSGKKLFKEMALYGVLQSTLPNIAVLLGILMRAELIYLVCLYFLTNAITVFFLYQKTKNFVENEHIDTQKTLHIGKHLTVMGIMSNIGGRLDSILIFQLLGGAELAIYSLAVTFPDLIRGSLKNITSLAIPKFAQKTKSEMKYAVWSKMGIFLLVSGIVVIMYIFSAPYIFKFLFPQYLVSIQFSQIYALSILTSFVLASAYFDSQVAVKERYILSVTNNVNKIIAVVLGVYFFGIWGAIAARLITQVINFALSGILIYRN